MTTKARLTEFVTRRWYGKPGLLLLLLPFAWLFRLLTALRRQAFRRGWLNRPVLPLPVVVVGNIAVGGTGKTPVVAWLASQLQASGYQPGIVSRGYGGAADNRTPLLVTAADAALFGDEPVLLAARTGCPVCVCSDRVAAVQRLAAEGVTVVLADDGLQHYRMRRVAEIVVVDGARGYGNGHLLPVGPLREPVSRLTSVDAVVVNGSSAGLAGAVFQLELLDACSLADQAAVPLADFAGQRVWAVAGIGNPERFYAQLENAGLVVDSVPLADHGRANLHELRATRAQPIVMTEKDAVKYSATEVAGCWFVPVRVVFSSADQEALLKMLRDRLQAGARPD